MNRVHLQTPCPPASHTIALRRPRKGLAATGGRGPDMARARSPGAPSARTALIAASWGGALWRGPRGLPPLGRVWRPPPKKRLGAPRSPTSRGGKFVEQFAEKSAHRFRVWHPVDPCGSRRFRLPVLPLSLSAKCASSPPPRSRTCASTSRDESSSSSARPPALTRPTGCAAGSTTPSKASSRPAARCPPPSAWTPSWRPASAIRCSARGRSARRGSPSRCRRSPS